MQKTFCKICDHCRKVLSYSTGQETKKKDYMTIFGLGQHPTEHFCNLSCWMKYYDLKDTKDVPKMP